ncbi:unnamed protein product [Lathyrus sativus]|nr:unnamed protein product [Lathyrus sativus]
MIISWNVMGLNKAGKVREISSSLRNLDPAITVLIETRVKKQKVVGIRKKLKMRGSYMDNYAQHDNGRIWIHWDDNSRQVEFVASTDQMIHCKVNDANDNFMFWMTAIYAQNQLHHRKKLWQDIEKICANQTGPWMLIGDFNNVMKIEDRIGGNEVTENEYKDLIEMMSKTELYALDHQGDYFTWSNKQEHNAIYSRIDHMLGNADWMQQNDNTTLTHENPNISDHSMLILNDNMPKTRANRVFKFINCSTDLDHFWDTVSDSWNMPMEGSLMFIVWRKLLRLQPHIKSLSKPLADVTNKILQTREKLTVAQTDLAHSRLNGNKIRQVKEYTAELLDWQEKEESMLKQRVKIEWLRHCDGNNKYFHASIRMRQQFKTMKKIQMEDGSYATDQKGLENAVLEFYTKLMGTRSNDLEAIDTSAMRAGSQLTENQRTMLSEPVTEKEIKDALDGIGNDKAPGLDGFGAYFFKQAWQIVKADVITTINDFF